MTVSSSAVIPLIESILPEDDLKARLTIGSWANTLLIPHGIQLLTVGGTAVDLHVSGALGTSSAYPSGWQESLDVDTIPLRNTSGVSNAEVAAILEQAGFEILGPQKHVRYPGVPYTIDLVGYGYPDDYSESHEMVLYVEDWEEVGLRPLRVAGPEDILFDYLESAVDTRHQRDWTRALAIATAMLEDLDLDYLYTKAHWRQDGALVPWLDKLMRGEPLRIGPGLRPY